MILEIIVWYLAILLAGWLVFPLVYRLLPYLPDRAISFAKPLGLLLWGYAFWLLTSLHVLQNDIGGVLFGLGIVAALSAWSGWKEGWRNIWGWLRENLKTVIVIEALFLVAFVGWAVVRATYPEASGTEKPMELAFINAILHSPTFPPHDPWLAGYAISYYYFGYVLVAMLARFTALPGSVAFNLGVAAWFGLAATTSFGVLYNLLSTRGTDKSPRQKTSVLVGSLLAPLFLLIVSNLEGLLEMLHAKGIFWQQAGNGLVSPFWSWLGIQELVNSPSTPFTWIPNRVGGIWWWRASRVLQDFDVSHSPREIIDEFPFFSYLLGDLHPHVLSMPFVLLAVGLALHLYLRERGDPLEFSFSRFFRRADTWLAVITLGGLAFLNTWDFPIYLALYGAAFILARYEQVGWSWNSILDFILLMITMGAGGVALYLPFYLGFQSQAGGILPSLIFFTRGTDFWIMFAPLLLPLAVWIGVLIFRKRSELRIGTGVLFAVGVVGGLWLLMNIYGALVIGKNAGIYGLQGGTSIFSDSLAERLNSPGTWLTLLVLMTFTWALLASFRRSPATAEAAAVVIPTTGSSPASGAESEKAGLSRESGSGGKTAVRGQPAASMVSSILIHPEPFLLLFILLGAGLTLVPEFFYLRDQFGWRMNTIFKFYYQAWILWSVAAAYASVVLWQRLKPLAATVWGIFWMALLAVSLIYPFFGIKDRTNNFNPEVWTLDSAYDVQHFTPDDWQGIEWLSNQPQGVVAEAVGGSYTSYARVATFTGQPDVLGWPGHESQWRGGAVEIGSREPDMETLYQSNNWDQVRQILQKYNIRYIFVGSLERGKYHVNGNFFSNHLTPVFQLGQVTIYDVSSIVLTGDQGKVP